ncbi:hypothetical protein ERJ75_000668300 [Trypanosoma vivax]|nr:hypothetical protein ERJ75_000668300 [Trypanosoma vivax]
MKKEDIAAALAAVAVNNVTGDASGVTAEERKKCHAFGSEDARSRHLDTSDTLAHAVALAVQAKQEWKQVAQLMDRAKKQPTRDCTAETGRGRQYKRFNRRHGDLESIGSPEDDGGGHRDKWKPQVHRRSRTGTRRGHHLPLPERSSPE